MKRLQCKICGFVYDKFAGDSEHGVEAGMQWEDIPENWARPECRVSKTDFEMMEI